MGRIWVIRHIFGTWLCCRSTLLRNLFQFLIYLLISVLIYWIRVKRTTALMAKWSSFSCYPTNLQTLCSFRVFVFLCKLRRIHFKTVHELKERFFCNHPQVWSMLHWTLWVISLQYYRKIQLWVRVAPTQYNRVNAGEWFCLWKHRSCFQSSKVQLEASLQPRVCRKALPGGPACCHPCVWDMQRVQWGGDSSGPPLHGRTHQGGQNKQGHHLDLLAQSPELGPWFLCAGGRESTHTSSDAAPSLLTRGSCSSVRNHPQPLLLPSPAQDSEITGWSCLISTWADF